MGTIIDRRGSTPRVFKSGENTIEAARQAAVAQVSAANAAASAAAAKLDADAAGASARLYATRADAVAALAVGVTFTSAETGVLRTYQRTGTSPFYVDLGDAFAPLGRNSITTITLEQFGGKADFTGNPATATDNYAALVLAMGVANRFVNPVIDLTASWPHVFEIVCRTGMYYFSQMPDVKVGIRIVGQASGLDDFNYGTSFVVAAGQPGPTFNTRNTAGGTTVTAGTSAAGSYLRGIALYSLGGGTSFTGSNIASNTYGMWLRTPVILEDCAIIGFMGNQIQIVARSGYGGALEGNANGWVVKGQLLLKGPDGSGHGIYIKGADTNVGHADKIQVRQCGLSGLFEDDTLGSNYVTVQVDDWNGQRRVSGSVGGCTYGGKYYLLIDPTAGIGASTTPGTNASVWCLVNDNYPSSTFFPAWSGSGNYAVAMPVFISGNSSSTSIQNLYTESGWSHIDGGAGGTGAIVWGGSGASRLTKRSRGVTVKSGLVNTIASQRGWAQLVEFASTDLGYPKFGNSIINVLGGDDSADLENGVLHRVTTALESVNYVERHTGTDIIREAGVGAARQPYWRLTGKNTTRQFGRGAAQPYLTELPGFFLGNPNDYSGGDARNISYASAAPTSGGPFAKGEIVFNNNPGPGKPEYWRCVVTGSPGTWIGKDVTPFQSGAAVSALTGTTSETVLATLSLSANLLGPNGTIDVDALWTLTNNANTKTLRARLGGASGLIFWSQAVGAFNTARGSGRIQNRNSPLAQVAFAGASFGSQGSAVITGAIDTTAAQTVVITGQLANAADSITLESYSVRITPDA